MQLPEIVKAVFESETFISMATCSADGRPNICNVGGKFLRSDGKIIVVDNYMDKTLKNILENNEVALLVRKDRESYQIKGTARYVTSGAEYDEAYKWMKAVGEKYPVKGALIMEVLSVFNSMSGPDAGKRMA
ncbi:MAG: pyridoxamine 5'-phosphate oxidase family protein [Candidatus Wallbacteria bacterium]|nr:pyridoxamine 5'-phosphate oxidase family protein [Candidatus Wallbacteria bacterium]